MTAARRAKHAPAAGAGSTPTQVPRTRNRAGESNDRREGSPEPRSSTSPLVLDISRPVSVLVLGAHADDIEIGCGGTLLRVLAEAPAVDVRWHVFSAPGARRAEALRSAGEWTKGAAKVDIQIARFKESYFPDQWASIKERMAAIRRSVDPDLVFTHTRVDRHQDHRVLAELTWNAFRGHTILEYEIPKYEGDLGHPSVYVALTEEVCQRKVSALMTAFPTQLDKPWFTPDTFWGLLRLRGIECGPRARFAEAFHAGKVVL